MYPKEKLVQGARFIDLGKSYQDVLLCGVAQDPNNDYKLSVWWYPSLTEPTVIIEIDKYNEKVFPDLHAPHVVLFDRFKELAGIYRNSFKQVERVIFKSEYKKIEVAKLIDHIAKTYKVTLEEADAIIKLNIAKGFFKFESQKGGDFIKLADFAVDYENKKRFLQAIADEIISKSERVELLMKHSSSKGSYREILVRSVLKKYLPDRYEVATGFIEGCDRQCDVLIYDKLNFSPLFRENDLVVLPPQSVRAIIEVKTTLDSNQLEEALELLWEVARHKNYPAPIFKGIFAFQPGYESETSIANAIANYYSSEEPKGSGITKEILYLFEFINAVCVLNKQCVFSELIDTTYQDDSIRPRLYSVHSADPDLNPHSVTFFNELFSFLDVDKHAKKININLFKALDNDILYKMEREVYPIGWKPSSSFKDEHKFDSESIWRRVSNVINWKAGNLSTQELEEIYFSETYKIKDYRALFHAQNK